MPEYVTNIRAVRKKGIDGGDEFTFVGEGALTIYSRVAGARRPGPDSGDVAAGLAFMVEAGQKVNDK